jgi:hypothetical protein
MGGPVKVIAIGQESELCPDKDKRLKQNMTDVSFAKVEGLFEVAHFERPLQVSSE